MIKWFVKDCGSCYTFYTVVAGRRQCHISIPKHKMDEVRQYLEGLPRVVEA